MIDWGSAGPANGGKSSIAVVPLFVLTFANMHRADHWILYYIGFGFVFVTSGSETFPALFNCILDVIIAHLESISIERDVLIIYHVTTYQMGATHPGMPTPNCFGMAVYLDSHNSYHKG